MTADVIKDLGTMARPLSEEAEAEAEASSEERDAAAAGDIRELFKHLGGE